VWFLFCQIGFVEDMGTEILISVSFESSDSYFFVVGTVEIVYNEHQDQAEFARYNRLSL